MQSTEWCRAQRGSNICRDVSMNQDERTTRGQRMEAATSFPEIEPVKGFRYKERVFVVERDDEARLLGHCGIDVAVFGGNIDPSAFISFAIQEGVRNGIS